MKLYQSNINAHGFQSDNLKFQLQILSIIPLLLDAVLLQVLWEQIGTNIAQYTTQFSVH